MHTEYEVRVLEIDVEKFSKKLEEIGAKKEWDLVQKRYVYDLLEEKYIENKIKIHLWGG